MAGTTSTIDIHGVQYPDCGFSQQLQEFLGNSSLDPEDNWFEKIYQNIQPILDDTFGINDVKIKKNRELIKEKQIQGLATRLGMTFDEEKFSCKQISTNEEVFKKQWIMGTFFAGIATFMFADPSSAFQDMVKPENPFWNLSFSSSGKGSADSEESLQSQLRACTLRCSNTSSSGLPESQKQNLSTLLMFSSLLEKPSSSRTPGEKKMMQEVYAEMGRQLNS
mmetsp:Transcript_26190/g.66548  ORF Transcript_26190/g.66548 Transcript_26190/m.66548 type:complete len:222 (-) Transcript_26190:98-763(-)